MKHLFFLIFLLIFSGHLLAEPPLQRQREFFIPATAAIHQLDSLSIIEDSFSIYTPDNLPLNPAFYTLDALKAQLQLRLPDFMLSDTLRVKYSVWPLNFSEPLFARDTSLIKLPGPGEDLHRQPIARTFPDQGLLRFEGLQSSGSITRGITAGNQRDAALNSAMNLQLSGKLSEEISILAVISDQNIPFQPEGTTQQIQDFDKVFIQLSGAGATLTAGDFETDQPIGHFLNLNRKARGASLSYETQAEDSLFLKGAELKSTVAAAISRGKYARNQISGMEGNQGPYRLTGNNNESFIIILAGSERVYVDGTLLTRGMENDYIIDYNLAELTFMPALLITRDSRIVVEFEYAERNYARSMVYTTHEVSTENAGFFINFFSEQDHPNQPLFQDMSQRRREIMAAVGDSIHKAFDWNLDSTGFKNDRVMYRLTDSLGFDTVFVYSTDPAHAHYEVGFSYVGQGNGYYRQLNSNANGRVYEWVAPQNGMLQGTHQPIISLVAPGKHQMLNLGGEYTLTSNTTARVEYALSNRDINLFSELHKENNAGHAVRMEINDRRNLNPASNTTQSWKVNTGVSYEFTDQNFAAPERYREIEFERNWNLEPATRREHEHLPAASFSVLHPEKGAATYNFEALLRGETFNGYMNRINSRFRLGRNRLQFNGSLLNSEGLRETQFYRHAAEYSRDLRFLRAGVAHNAENNEIRLPEQQSLMSSSFSYQETKLFLTNPEGTSQSYEVFFKQRDDRVPVGEGFEHAARARDYGLRHSIRNQANHRHGIQLIYRELELTNPLDESIPNDRALNARADHFIRLAEGAITSNIFYQAASSAERKRDYIYVEVPAGQGAYVWNDYNGNGIMELDEFEISPYPEEANFIRVYIPSEEFIRTYSTGISHSINLEPAVLWREAAGLRGFLGRFNNRLNYRIDKKNQGGMWSENFNPFYTDVADTLLITLSASIRNTLFFNRTSRIWSLEWTVLENSNKSILSNGYESRVLQTQSWRARWNMTREFSLIAGLEYGDKINESEFFTARNYHIRYIEPQPSVSYQPTAHLRFSLFYSYSRQRNVINEGRKEQAQIHKAGVESRISFPARGNLQLRYQVSQIQYPFNENTPLAFEMLQALRPGTNNLWSVNWQQNLSSYLQLALNYNGRKPPGLAAIHTGTVQLRAMF